MDTEGAIANGRYRLMSMLGEGGQATVYRAWDDRLGVWRAIKRLRPDSPRSLRERFEIEARTLARLKHPNLLVVHDVGEENGQPYMVMDLAAESLADRIEREGPLSPASACLIAEAIASALCVAHSAGVVHRDIKPANILADEAGRPLLSDFGIAQIADLRRTKTDAVMGTPLFMAPEQYGAAASADARADIYSLGATLYAAITGHEPAGPIEDLTDGALIAIPKVLRPLLSQATARTPDRRYPSAEAFREALAGALPALAEGGAPAVWRPPRTQGTPPTEILSESLALKPGPTAIPEKSHATYGLTSTRARTTQSASLVRLLPVAALAIAGLFGVFVVVAALTAGVVSLWVAQSLPPAPPSRIGELQRLTAYPPDVSIELFGLSSDGTALLYREGETGLLWRHPIDGTTPKTRLHPEIEEPLLAGYFNEDLYALIDKDGQLALRDLRSGEVLPFRHQGHQFELSPGADRIAWHDGRSAFQIPVGGSEPTAVFTAPEGQLIHGIAWSPDQEWLVFVVIGEMKSGDSQLRVVVADARGMMSSRPIYTSGKIAYTDQSAPVVWPWPGAVLISEQDPERDKGNQHLVVVPIDGGAPTHLETLPMQVGQLAARRGHLAVLGWKSMQDTWLAQVGEGGLLLDTPARLWADEDADAPIAWLQDGSLAYTSDRFRGWKLLAQRTGDYEVRVLAEGELIAVAGRELVKLLDDGTLERAPLARDTPWVPSQTKRWDALDCAESGECVAARTLADGIEILSFAEGARTGSPLGKLLGPRQVTIALSSDGRDLALLERATERAVLRLFDLQERLWREIPLEGLYNPQEIAWRTDGEGWWVTTASWKGGSGPVLAAVDPSGRPERITALDGWSSRVVPSPDGSLVAFSVHRRDVDLWVADLPDTPPAAGP